MISYELAKKLKDVGFPFNEDNPCGHCGYDGGSNHPTLSELIEGCGEDFIDLSKEGKGWEACAKYYCCVEHGEGRKYKLGSTPEEAVANLWLALNTK